MMNTNDRFELEKCIIDIDNVSDELDALLTLIGDLPERPTEDQLMNMVIGISELHKCRYKKLWMCFESLVQTGVIANPTSVHDDE